VVALQQPVGHRPGWSAPLTRYERAAPYVDKIIKGAHPASLPVEQPTKFQVVINMKTAAASP
jgi:putative ABC transport system substrate-binding protein